MPRSRDADLLIVGAGAAGLAAAIFAGEASGGRRRIVLLDGARSIGAKILVSGGGRCNVTHHRVVPDDYFSSTGSRAVVRNVLAAFDERRAAAWFESMGVRLKREETGKLFPVTDKARTVLDALLRRCADVGAEVRPASRVIGVQREGDDGFLVRLAEGPALRAARVVLATGGRSLPKTGSDGAGYDLARSLGHTVTPTWPGLVPLVLAPAFFHARCTGLAVEAELTTTAAGKVVDRRAGSLLWTHFGISGPVAMDASRHYLAAADAGAAELRCSLTPGRPFDAVERWVMEEAQRRPTQTVARLLAVRWPERLATALAEHAGVAPATALGQLPREDRRRLVHTLTALVLPVERGRGWDFAEVTAGGVPLGEVDYRTMASRRCPGLHLAGELLDCDGRIGGFNFQWAWATGYLAGTAAGKAL